MLESKLTNLRTVWRLENAQGQGPFQDRRTFDIFMDDFGGRPNQPSPKSDPEIGPILKTVSETNSKDWVFGFNSIADYKRWFCNEFENTALAQLGYYLSQYTIDDEFVHSGKGQCLFWRPAALQYDDP